MTIEVHFPRVLSPIVGDHLHGTIEVDERSQIRAALEQAWPGLANHLFDASGVMRPHVLCFVDDSADRLESDGADIRDGSEIRFVQAVSGG